MKKFMYGIGIIALLGLIVPSVSNATLFKGSGLTTNSDGTNPALTVNCVNGDDSRPCSTYTTTNSAKKGSLKINVNGTTRYIYYYEGPV